MINEKIDEILAGYLNKEPLTDEGRQRLEEWLHASPQNEKFGKLVFKLESRKKELDKHQAQEVVFAKIRCYINRKRRKRHLLLWSSCAAGIAIVVGLFFVLRWGL